MKNQPAPFNNDYRVGHLKQTILYAIIAYLAGGFLAGMVWCQSCGFNPFARLFVSLIMGIASIFTFGFPPANESGVGEALNAWPYIFICWLALYARWFYLHFKKSGNQPPEA